MVNYTLGYYINILLGGKEMKIKDMKEEGKTQLLKDLEEAFNKNGCELIEVNEVCIKRTEPIHELQIGFIDKERYNG